MAERFNCHGWDCMDNNQEVRKAARDAARSAAKGYMMFIMFGANGNNPGAREITFANEFPNVYAFMKLFKRLNGYEKFSIELQRMEADIMIDNVWYLLKQEGLFAIPRHDSMLLRKSELSRALEIMNGHFDKIGFKCKTEIK